MLSWGNKKEKLEDMQMKLVDLTDRMGRMFGHACRTRASNESGIGVPRNSCLLSVLIRTAKLDLPDLHGMPSDLHLWDKDMFHVE